MKKGEYIFVNECPEGSGCDCHLLSGRTVDPEKEPQYAPPIHDGCRCFLKYKIDSEMIIVDDPINNEPITEEKKRDVESWWRGSMHRLSEDGESVIPARSNKKEKGSVCSNGQRGK